MNRLIASLGMMGIVTASLVLISPATAGSDQEKGSPCRLTGKQPCQAGCDHLKTILKSIDLAIKDLEAGKQQTALGELKKTKSLIEQLQTTKPAPVKKITKATASDKPKFVNDRCPIMGTPINPNKVPTNLTREYKGQKIAFCCGGCPGEWDKLSDQEKEAKLKASTSHK